MAISMTWGAWLGMMHTRSDHGNAAAGRAVSYNQGNDTAKQLHANVVGLLKIRLISDMCLAG
jgi:hypothetical protein